MKVGPDLEDPRNTIARFSGIDVSEVTVAVVEGSTFELTFKVNVLERRQTFLLRGVRELPDVEELFNATTVLFLHERDSGREFGVIKVEILGEMFSEFYADSVEQS